MDGSHSLQAFVNDVARDVPDPARLRQERARGQARSGPRARRGPTRRRAKLQRRRPADRRARLRLGLHGVSRPPDHRVAQPRLRRRRQRGGVYHSVYDSFYWYTQFSDGDFTHAAALSRVIGTAILRLADADVLPFEFGGTATTLRGYVDEIAEAARATPRRRSICSRCARRSSGCATAAERLRAALALACARRRSAGRRSWPS